MVSQYFNHQPRPASSLFNEGTMERDYTWFLLEQSSHTIAIRTSIERGRVLRALTLLRRALIRDIHEVFSGTEEGDETYLGGQWKNKRKTIREEGTKEGEVPRNNLFLESSVVMEQYGPKW